MHPDDQDALRIWRDVIGIPDDRIGRLEDNWWGPVGATGPNGPDSEIYFDRGPSMAAARRTVRPVATVSGTWRSGTTSSWSSSSTRTAPARRSHGSMSIPAWAWSGWSWSCSRWSRSTTSISIRRSSSTCAGLAGVTYGGDPDIDRALRIIADHARGGTFLIADGVLPGNEGRSYVLRRILRRAIRAGRKLGLEEPFLAAVAGVVIDQFAHHHRELTDRRVQIEKVLAHEEESFGRTLSAGMARFQALVEDLAPGCRGAR